MKLGEAKNVKQVGRWLQDHGISPGEHRAFGTVHKVHAVDDDGNPVSLHYMRGRPGVVAENWQGNLALDVNDHDVSDDKFSKKFGKVDSETEALTIVYFKILRVAERKEWPLDEMFFWKWGFRKETGYDYNTPIGGHDTHLHVGFFQFEW